MEIADPASRFDVVSGMAEPGTHRFSLTAAPLGGESFCVSIDPADLVSDLIAECYDVMWTDMKVDDFEARWISSCIVLIHGDKVLPLDASVKDAIGQDGVHLTVMIREATAEEQLARCKASRVRQSKRKQKLVPKELPNTLFSRDLLGRAALALRRGRQVSGFHMLKCKIGQLEWTEEDWSWTLLHDHTDNQFVWRHQQRGHQAVLAEAWDTEDEFVHFWGQLSERTACAYASLLLYADRAEAALLQGTVVSNHFNFPAPAPD